MTRPQMSHLEIRTRAIVDIITVPLEMQDRLAVITPVRLELVKGLDERANQTGSHLLQTLGDDVY